MRALVDISCSKAASSVAQLGAGGRLRCCQGLPGSGVLGVGGSGVNRGKTAASGLFVFLLGRRIRLMIASAHCNVRCRAAGMCLPWIWDLGNFYLLCDPPSGVLRGAACCPCVYICVLHTHAAAFSCLVCCS